MIAADGVTIGRARIGGVRHAGQTLATHLAVSSALAGADLRPPGLPPSAVLVVWRLDVPGKRLLAKPVGRVDPAWERAARTAVADQYRRAARPLDGPIAADSVAVLFRDEAEMVACLALDISRGRAAERWWWQWQRKRWGGLGRHVLGAVLAESARAVPAALALLAERGEAMPVLQALPPVEARLVLEAVCRAFDVAPPDLAGQWAVDAVPNWREDLVPQTDLSAGSGAPWAPWSPRDASVASLPPENVCLLGIALTLAHAPARARSIEFMRATERWWRAEPRTRDRSAAAASDIAMPAEGVGPAMSVPAPGAAAHREARRDPPNVAGTQAVTEADRPPDVALPEQAVPHAAKSRAVDRGQQAGDRPDGPDVAIETAADAGWSAQPAADGELAVRVATAPEPPLTALPVLPDGVVTELGGVLFLINVMRRLDLPGCFEPEWRLASQVGPWGVLELLGRALLLDAARLPTFRIAGNLADLAADPLWAALALVDGRQAGEPAGVDVTGPDTVQIPAAWARWLDASSAAGQRVDLAGVSPLDGPLLAGVSRDLRRWLASVVPLLRRILHNVSGDEINLAADLLLRRGRLYVTSSHVDLVLPLAGVSLAVRRAGLDFDPGWLPDFGRVVQFHYE